MSWGISGLLFTSVLEGYAWDGKLSTYRCFGDQKRCPGGPVRDKGQQCADGRDSDSIACVLCEVQVILKTRFSDNQLGNKLNFSFTR